MALFASRRGRVALWALHLLLLGVPIALALAGYLYGLERGVLLLELIDTAPPSQRELTMQLADGAGAVVLTGRIAGGTLVVPDYPTLASCQQDIEGSACREARARWIATVAPQVATITFGDAACRIRNLPLQLQVDREIALTWWIPDPRFGGTPYSRWRGRIEFDRQRCRLLH